MIAFKLKIIFFVSVKWNEIDLFVSLVFKQLLIILEEALKSGIFTIYINGSMEVWRVEEFIGGR